MKTKMLKLTAAAIVLTGAGALAGCSTAVPLNDPVYTRMARLHKQVQKLQKVVKNQGLMNVASGQEQMTQQVADLQGQIQTLQHQIHQLKQHEHAVDQNYGQRLTSLEGGSPTGFAAGPGAAGTNSNGAAATRNAEGGASGAQPGSNTSRSGSANRPGAGESGAQQSDAAAYQAAFAKLRAGKNAAAISAFNKFVQSYPNSHYVPNALYWTAETHYVNGQYKDAIGDFKKVLSKYPDSPKAADSYLKVGYAQYAMGNYKQARSTFKSVISKYPGTTPAHLAKQRLQKMGQ